MLNIQSTTCLKENCRQILSDKYSNSNFIESANHSNCNTAMNVESKIVSRYNYAKQVTVNKTFEMHRGTISESYFDISDRQEAKEFIEDYSRNLNSGLILVLNNEHKLEDVVNLSSEVLNCIKLIIRYKTDNQTSEMLKINGIQQINSTSVKHAANEAYRRVKEKQAILFAHVNQGFDLFEHLEIV